jgi:hypothetical protein
VVHPVPRSKATPEAQYKRARILEQQGELEAADLWYRRSGIAASIEALQRLGIRDLPEAPPLLECPNSTF